MLEEVKKDAADRMTKCVAAYRNELKRLRTGRASASLVDHIRVDYYGAESPLNQVANIAVEDARTLTIVPYDKNMVSVIEKAIMKSDLGLMPATAGNVIRVPLPAMNEQRRKELVKVVHKYAEDGHIAIRHARTHAREQLKKMEGVSEDDVRAITDDVADSVTDGPVTFTFTFSEDVGTSFTTDDVTVTFKLKEGVQWHKGYGEVTTEDVKFSYERFLDPELQAVYRDDWAALDQFTDDFIAHVQPPPVPHSSYRDRSGSN